MKKILFAFLFVSNAHALVTPLAVWEFRPDSTAGSVNGGSYDPSFTGGTDYSQQPTANLSATDVAISAGNSNIISSVLTPFRTDHVGNAVHCTAGVGFNTGVNRFNIIIAVDGSGNATTSGPVGTAGSTNGTCRVGGSLGLNSAFDDTIFEAIWPATTAWFHSGTYTTGQAVSVTTDAENDRPIWIMGYGKVRGDIISRDTSPVINFGANTMIFAGDFINFRNMYFTGTPAAGFSGGAGTQLYNVKGENTSTANRIAITNGASMKISFSDISSPNGTALSIGANNTLIASWIHNSTIGFITGTNDENLIYGNIFSMCYATAAALGATPANSTTGNGLHYNTFYGSSPLGGVGIALAGQSANNSMIGNQFINLSTGIQAHNGFSSVISENNNFFGNGVNITTTVRNGPTTTFINPVFSDLPTQNFMPTNTDLKIVYGFGSSASTNTVYPGALQPPVVVNNSPSVILRNAIIRDGIAR